MNTQLRNFKMCHWVAKQFSRAISRSSSVGKTMAAMYHGSVADPGIGRWMCWSLLSLPILSFSWHPFPVLSFREAATLNPAMGSGKACRLSLRAGQSPVAKRFWCILSQKIGCSSLTNSAIKYFQKNYLTCIVAVFFTGKNCCMPVGMHPPLRCPLDPPL